MSASYSLTTQAPADRLMEMIQAGDNVAMDTVAVAAKTGRQFISGVSATDRLGRRIVSTQQCAGRSVPGVHYIQLTVFTMTTNAEQSN